MTRKKRTASEWRLLKAEQLKSGQSQEEWCIANGVNLYTYRDRISRLKKMDEEETNRETMFIQAKRRMKKESIDTSMPANTEQTTWVEVNLEEIRQSDPSAISNGKLVIEMGMLRMTANASFPVNALATLLREMMIPC